MSINHKSLIAPRLSMSLAGVSVPVGMWVLHHCDNPPCVNPAHLYVGTAKDNVRDMWARGRQAPNRTHCKRGHEMTEANLLPNKRACRRCDNANHSARNKRVRLARRLAAGMPAPTPLRSPEMGRVDPLRGSSLARREAV